MAISVADALRIVAEAMGDQRYRQTPLGEMVGRYVRWLRNERGGTARTVQDYESVLARMCLALEDREVIEVTTEDLREVIDLWANQSARTRAKVASVIRSFWQWCADESHVGLDPTLRIRRPRAERKVARTLPADARGRLLRAAKSPRDRVALRCLLGLGIRKAELAGIRMRDLT
jgi:site-specific recombinase XerD